jgi:hypothetical protein
MPALFSNPEMHESVTGNVLLDTGSDSTMITTSLAKDLNLYREKIQLTLKGIGDSKSQLETVKISLNLDLLDKKFSTTVTNILVVQEISSAIRSKDWTKYLTSLGKESSSPIGNGEITMLVLHIQRVIIYRTDNHPIAIRYDLGWSCFDRPADKSMALFPTLLLNKKEEHNDIKEIHKLLRTSWTYDQFPSESLTQNEEH